MYISTPLNDDEEGVVCIGGGGVVMRFSFFLLVSKFTGDNSYVEPRRILHKTQSEISCHTAPLDYGLSLYCQCLLKKFHQ
jgi:hypothetical protein